LVFALTAETNKSALRKTTALKIWGFMSARISNSPRKGNGSFRFT
jgi:hypothetical protein